MNTKSYLFNSDTIVAESSPHGRGAIGLVRISGSQTLTLLQTFCKSTGSKTPDFASYPRQAFLCSIMDGDHVVDDALVVFFQCPHSYTGEDCAEVTLHGNPLIISTFLSMLTSFPGVRPAYPGEFTQRAFLNDKMDLVEAEAVRRVIEARSEYELLASRKMLTGDLSRQIARLRSGILNIKAEVEAAIDFSTEDLTFETKEQLIKKTESYIQSINEILNKADATDRLSSGFRIALIGLPNAGKSSLLNAMLGWDRAIVSDEPGTTRDTLHEEFMIDGVMMKLVDTAGIRETEHAIEGEGVRRSQEEIKRSSIVIFIIDGSEPQMPDLDLGNARHVIKVINKIDKLNKFHDTLPSDWIQISCKTKEGLEDLKNSIRKIIFENPLSKDSLLLEERHRYSLNQMSVSLKNAINLWKENALDEIVAIEIDRALEHAGNITGKITNEDVLGRIFSLFCVGK